MANQRFSTAPDGGKRIEFDFTFWTDRDHGTDYTFGAIPMVDPVQIARINKLASRRTGDGTLELIEAVKSAVRRMLDDSDGTPADWFPAAAPEPSPEPLPAVDVPAWPSEQLSTPEIFERFGGGMLPATTEAQADAYTEDAELLFIAPDGQALPYAEVIKYSEFGQGSSLRRWNELMDGDRDLIIPVDQLLQAWRWLIAQAGKGHSGR